VSTFANWMSLSIINTVIIFHIIAVKDLARARKSLVIAIDDTRVSLSDFRLTYTWVVNAVWFRLYMHFFICKFSSYLSIMAVVPAVARKSVLLCQLDLTQVTFQCFY